VVGLVGFLAVSYIWTDQVWESGFGRFWGPWLGAAMAGAAGLVMALGRRRKAVWVLFAVAALVFTVEAALARGTPIVAALVGGARDGAGIRTSQLADPGLVGTSEVSGTDAQAAAVEPPQAGELAAPALDARPVYAWSADQVAAADFLRQQAGARDVIITNEVDAFLVPALTRRQTFISGAPYQGLYGSTSAAELIPGRLAANAGFLEGTQTAAVSEVCAAGAKWVWLAVDRSPQVDPASLGTVAFSNDSVTVIRLNSSSCPR